MKLELDYKLETAKLNPNNTDQLNEFLYYEADQLIGYIGISSFGGNEFEINGMVHPDFRRQGIFTKLYVYVLEEQQRRMPSKMLLLSDSESVSGIGFLNNIHAVYDLAEYEMKLKASAEEKPQSTELKFRKATNDDAQELARQNRIYFNDVHDAEPESETLIMPEEEEKKGMIIYIAEKQDEIIGKVNLAINGVDGAIYGLGVLPNHRRKGYGRELLLKSIQIFNEKNCETIMLQVVADNKKALDLYLDCGFVTVATMNYYQA